MGELSQRQRQIKDQFIEVRGYWAPFLEALLELAPEFLEAYVVFSGVPWTAGSLQPKFKELVYVAIDAATTHLYEPGLRAHIRNALRYGATKEELIEVLELVSLIGIHSCAVGVPALMAEVRQTATGAGAAERRVDRLRLKEEYAAWHGGWPEYMDELLTVAPDFVEAYVALANVPWSRGVLEPKFKELICLAVDAATTHLYEPGLRAHLQNALKQGATKEEIVEVLEMVSVLGIHTCTVGMPILLEELERLRR